jgi:hypothetical protein
MRSWHSRSDSMMPLMPSPGSPKTVSTPHSNRHSTMRSAAVAAMGHFLIYPGQSSLEEQQGALPEWYLQSSISERKRERKVRQAGLLPTKDVTFAESPRRHGARIEDRASRPRRDVPTSCRSIDYFFLGTFLPFFRALESAMAMACFLLFTLPALPPLPLFAFPRL